MQSMALAAMERQTMTLSMQPFRDTLTSGVAETGESVTPGRSRKRKRWDSQRASHLATSLWAQSGWESSTIIQTEEIPACIFRLTTAVRVFYHFECGDWTHRFFQTSMDFPSVSHAHAWHIIVKRLQGEIRHAI